jgi:hypothetical protein
MLMQNPGFLSLSSLHRTAIAARESNYFLLKFFKTLLKNFAPVCHGIHLCDISWSSSYFLISGPGLGFKAGS